MTRTWTIAPGLSRNLRAFVQNPTRTEAGETSLVQFAASCGVTYSIVVDGFNGAATPFSCPPHVLLWQRCFVLSWRLEVPVLGGPRPPGTASRQNPFAVRTP